MPRTYTEYFAHKNCQCNTSRTFRFSLYQTIEKADMSKRKQLSLVFPKEVAEVLQYEGHKPFDNYPPVLLNLLCDIHGIPAPDFEKMFSREPVKKLRDHYEGELRQFLDHLERSYNVMIDAPIHWLPDESIDAKRFSEVWQDEWHVVATIYDGDKEKSLFWYAVNWR